MSVTHVRTHSVRYPSVVTPAPAPFELALPEGWGLGETLDALLVAAPPAEPGAAFLPNVAVTAEKTPAGLTLEAIAEAAALHLHHRCLDVRFGPHAIVRLGRDRALRRTARFVLPDAGVELVQQQTLIAAPQDPRRRFRCVYEVAATAAADAEARWSQTFAEILDSFRLLPA